VLFTASLACGVNESNGTLTKSGSKGLDKWLWTFLLETLGVLSPRYAAMMLTVDEPRPMKSSTRTIGPSVVESASSKSLTWESNSLATSTNW
jgi:hypothetical protein